MTKPRFLADENVPRPIVDALRRARYSVATLPEMGQRSLSDPRVLLRARRERRILLTNDTDFLHVTDVGSGILLLRTGRAPPEDAARALLHALDAPLPPRPAILVLASSGLFVLRTTARKR